MKKLVILITLFYYCFGFSQKLMLGDTYQKIIGKNKNYKYLIIRDSNHVFAFDFTKKYTIAYVFNDNKKNSICVRMFLEFKSKRLENRLRRKLKYYNQLGENVWTLKLKKNINVLVNYDQDIENDQKVFIFYLE